MIPPEILQSKSLFSLLYKIDQDLAERTRARHCPFAGVRCIAPIISESHEVGPLILPRLLRFVSACAVADRTAGAVCCRHRLGSGAAGFTGHPWCFWSPLFAKAKILRSPWNVSRGYADCGDRRSNDGSVGSKIFSPKVTVTKACVVFCCPGLLRTRVQGH
jgi:hypothetical protein